MKKIDFYWNNFQDEIKINFKLEKFKNIPTEDIKLENDILLILGDKFY